MRDFGSLENMQNQLSAASVAVQGSGWGWLGYNRQTSRLQLATTFNQDLLEPTHGSFHFRVSNNTNIFSNIKYLVLSNINVSFATWRLQLETSFRCLASFLSTLFTE